MCLNLRVVLLVSLVAVSFAWPRSAIMLLQFQLSSGCPFTQLFWLFFGRYLPQCSFDLVFVLLKVVLNKWATEDLRPLIPHDIIVAIFFECGDSRIGRSFINLKLDDRSVPKYYQIKYLYLVQFLLLC